MSFADQWNDNQVADGRKQVEVAFVHNNAPKQIQEVPEIVEPAAAELEELTAAVVGELNDMQSKLEQKLRLVNDRLTRLENAAFLHGWSLE